MWEKSFSQSPTKLSQLINLLAVIGIYNFVSRLPSQTFVNLNKFTTNTYFFWFLLLVLAKQSKLRSHLSITIVEIVSIKYMLTTHSS